MPLTNDVIMKLNQITTLVQDKSNVENAEIEEIKSIFRNILESGQDYNVEEIESWFENEGSWNNKDVRVRITNLSHYVQSKYEQTARFRIVSSDDDSCSCGN